MAKLLIILFVGLICEAIGVVLLSRGLKEITGWLLTPAELKDSTALATLLTEHPDALSQRLWQNLPPGDQALLSDTHGSPQRKQEVLLGALNWYIEKGPELSGGTWRQLPLSPETKRRLQHTPAASDQMELRRLIVQDTYSTDITQRAKRTIGMGQVIHLIGRGASNAHILLGVFFEAIFFVGLLMLMSKADVSFVWPLTSLSFVVTTIAAKLYLHEEVSVLRWSGVCLIMLGAALISWTECQHNAPSETAPVPAPGQVRELPASQ
jgi:hypothetical protein